MNLGVPLVHIELILNIETTPYVHVLKSLSCTPLKASPARVRQEYAKSTPYSSRVVSGTVALELPSPTVSALACTLEGVFGESSIDQAEKHTFLRDLYSVLT